MPRPREIEKPDFLKVRLETEDKDLLREHARALGCAPSTLARMMIIDVLRGGRPSRIGLTSQPAS